MFQDIQSLMIFHTLLSVIALILGIPAVLRLFHSDISALWTKSFLVTAVVTTLTGFFFPIQVITPAVATGIVASMVFAGMFLAYRIFHLKGAWRWIYSCGMVASLYLLVFVAIAQSFGKIPFLQETGQGLGGHYFAVCQIIALVIFIVVGVKAAKKF